MDSDEFQRALKEAGAQLMRDLDGLLQLYTGADDDLQSAMSKHIATIFDEITLMEKHMKSHLRAQS